MLKLLNRVVSPCRGTTCKLSIVLDTTGWRPAIEGRSRALAANASRANYIEEDNVSEKQRRPLFGTILMLRNAPRDCNAIAVCSLYDLA